MNTELESMWKESAMDLFGALSQNLPEGTEENQLG
jgi:hypothetical protein